MLVPVFNHQRVRVFTCRYRYAQAYTCTYRTRILWRADHKSRRFFVLFYWDRFLPFPRKCRTLLPNSPVSGCGHGRVPSTGLATLFFRAVFRALVYKKTVSIVQRGDCSKNCTSGNVKQCTICQANLHICLLAELYVQTGTPNRSHRTQYSLQNAICNDFSKCNTRGFYTKQHWTATICRPINKMSIYQ